VTAGHVGQSLTEATSSSRFTVPNFWADPKSGVGYQVQVEVPPARMNSLEDIKNIPISRNKNVQIDLRNVADVTQGTVLGEIDRYNTQRMLTLAANIGGEDLGGVADRVSQAIAKAGEPPQGVNVAVRGQVVPMAEIFRPRNRLSSRILIFCAETARIFQSSGCRLRRATIPAVVRALRSRCGSAHDIEPQSLMGAIAAIGVAVANAILLVSFANATDRRRNVLDAWVGRRVGWAS
jgi:multidrug efflux pump subunit AcrB